MVTLNPLEMTDLVDPRSQKREGGDRFIKCRFDAILAV